MSLENLKMQIDEFIYELLNQYNIIKIYGGITSQTIEKRLEQHSSEDKFINMRMAKIDNCETYNYEYAKELEQYLINQLDNVFNNKCINDRNKDGTIAQRGGVGRKPNNLVKYELYVMCECVSK